MPRCRRAFYQIHGQNIPRNAAAPAREWPCPLLLIQKIVQVIVALVHARCRDGLGRFLLELASEEPLHPDEIAALDEAEAEIARGERASPQDVRAFWRSHGL